MADHTLKHGIIRVQLDFAPEKNGKKFDEWCKKYEFDPLGSGRRAWCSSLSTYFRNALGVAFNPGGEMFLFYSEDLMDPEPKYGNKIPTYHVNATPDDEYPIRLLQAYRNDCDLPWITHPTDSEGSKALAKIMNEHQQQRAVILDKALEKLKEN